MYKEPCLCGADDCERCHPELTLNTECTLCGKSVKVKDTDFEGKCEDCWDCEKCSECGEIYEKEQLDEYGFCPECLKNVTER